jgi:arginyl-tRNA--protein-N-Asp/Glu arginylyltransferase
LSDLSELRFFLSSSQDCGYLPGRQSSNVFVDPASELNREVYAQLSELGFRRSGDYLYRPHCAQCRACQPLRVPIAEFKASKSQRRCSKRNQDLQHERVKSIDADEYFSLFERYINLRHQDGEMYPASRETFDNFLSPAWDTTEYLVLRDASGRLLSVAVTDILDDALSAIYSFFEPAEDKRSLGVYNILAQVEWAKKLNRRYLYLGYWIEECDKMAYKTQYRPYQILSNRSWVQFDR